MKYEFTAHALEKFEVLGKYDFKLTKNQVLNVVENPDRVEKGAKGRKIAQRIINDKLVLRVIYEEAEEMIKIITFYPGRRERYEYQI